MPWLRQLAAVPLPRSPGFDPTLVYVRFVVDKVALGQYVDFSPVDISALMLHAHSFICPGRCTIAVHGNIVT